MVQERTDLGDIRALAHLPENLGILSGGWDTTSPTPLSPDIQEMSDDILSWFDSLHGWKLVEFRSGFISRDRMKQTVGDLFGPKKDTPRTEPDRFTLAFHYDADNPPMIKRGLLHRREMLDFRKLFNLKLAGRYEILPWRDELSADVFDTKVGKVHPLEDALEKASSPYYLLHINVSANRRDVNDYMGIRPDTPRTHEPMKSLAVNVMMGDLLDYTRIEINKLRRDQARLIKNFDKPYTQS